MTIEKAHQAIGAYLCTFSTVDRELGQTVKVIFHDFMKPAKLAVPPEHTKIAKWHARVSSRHSAQA